MRMTEQLYALYNGTILGSAVDTDEAFSSGPTYLYMSPNTTITGVQVSNFTMGAASNTPPTPPPPSGPFMGSVVVVEGAPSSSNPFLGTVTVLDEAPSGVPNPYLGKVVVGSTPGGVPNPNLGNVVVIGSVPAGARDVFLGTVAESS